MSIVGLLHKRLGARQRRAPAICSASNQVKAVALSELSSQIKLGTADQRDGVLQDWVFIYDNVISIVDIPRCHMAYLVLA
jgi:hypothetical protein